MYLLLVLIGSLGNSCLLWLAGVILWFWFYDTPRKTSLFSLSLIASFWFTLSQYCLALQRNPDITKCPRKWQNVFLITRVRYIGALFHTFYYYWAEEYSSLYWGLRYLLYLGSDCTWERNNQPFLHVPCKHVHRRITTCKLTIYLLQSTISHKPFLLAVIP